MRSIQEITSPSEFLKGMARPTDEEGASRLLTEDTMKITRTNDIQPALQSRTQSRGGKAAAQTSGDGGPTRASLSKDAGFVNSVRSEAGSFNDVRPDKVAEAKGLLASGGLEASVDMDAMVDSLMADL